MQPDARKLLALSDEVDFPALRGQFRGENLPEIYRRLSEIAGADLMPLCETEQQLRQKMRIPADGEQPLNHRQKMVFCGENYAHLTTFTGAYEAERFLGLRAIQAMQLRDTSPGYAALGGVPVQSGDVADAGDAAKRLCAGEFFWRGTGISSRWRSSG